LNSPHCCEGKFNVNKIQKDEKARKKGANNNNFFKEFQLGQIKGEFFFPTPEEHPDEEDTSHS
jgi:hypothetical protein